MPAVRFRKLRRVSGDMGELIVRLLSARAETGNHE